MNNSIESKKILIVEDEPKLAQLLKDYLAQSGFVSCGLNNGLDVIPWVKQNDPDLILLDLLMPNCDGVTMLKELRNDAWGSRASVIVLTNVATQGKIMGIEKDSSSDMFTFLVKTDWSLDNLLVKIKERLKI